MLSFLDYETIKDYKILNDWIWYYYSKHNLYLINFLSFNLKVLLELCHYLQLHGINSDIQLNIQFLCLLTYDKFALFH